MDSIWENLRSDRSKWANWLYFSFSFSLIQRDKQRVSYLAIAILIVLWALMLISLFVSIGKKLQWLDLLYIVSYVKLAVTLIKYVPQVSLIASFSIGLECFNFVVGFLKIFTLITFFCRLIWILGMRALSVGVLVMSFLTLLVERWVYCKYSSSPITKVSHCSHCMFF